MYKYLSWSEISELDTLFFSYVYVCELGTFVEQLPV